MRNACEGPACRTALACVAADVSHSREPARSFGSEYGLDVDAFIVRSSLHSAYLLGQYNPGRGLLCAAEPDECWACSGAPHAFHTRPPTSHTSRVPEPST